MNSATDLRRLFLVAAVLPAVIVLVDSWAVPAASRSLGAGIAVYALFVGQVALLAWTVGRWLPQPLLCWTVFAWGLVLLDLWVLSLTDVYRQKKLCYAMISGQIGLMAVWAILGTGRWQWRLPAIAVLATLLGCFYLPGARVGDGWRALQDGAWSSVLLFQGVAILAASIVLRIRGYRLQRTLQPGTQDSSPAVHAFQFHIRHMLLWTAVVPVILALSKGLDWLFLRRFGGVELLGVLLIGLGLGIISLAAVWSALSRSSWLMRLLVLIVVPPVVGELCARMAMPAKSVSAWGAWEYYHLMQQIEDLGPMWAAWTALAAGLLAAMLLVFRARGYRLTRERRAEESRADGHIPL